MAVAFFGTPGRTEEQDKSMNRDEMRFNSLFKNNYCILPFVK